MEESICEIVRRMEQEYTAGNTTISKYVDFDMYETLNKIDAYLNSVHTSGPTDSLERDKPFFNIVTAARNIWYRATDLDRKNIKLKASSASQYVSSFIATLLLKSWMRKTGFGAFLNEWGRTLATYGSSVLKFVEKKGDLIPSVVPWNRIICDQIDFDNNVKIEVLEFTPAQLKKQDYDKEVVQSLLESLGSREDLAKQKKDNKAEYIKVYEVHGELPLSLLTDKEDDEDTYAQQMHVVSFVGNKKSGKGNFKTDYEDYTLYKGKEKKDPYIITHLIKEDGRTLGIGAVEHLFEAQWMVNHTAKQIKDTLDFASLLILQTSDGSFAGRNVLNSLVTGDVLTYKENNPLTQLNSAHDISQLQVFGAQWQNLAKEITSTPDALAGITPPSGTAFRLQALVTNEAQSLFELMAENKGLDCERMLREYVIPYLKTQMDTTEEISAILEANEIAQFDSLYVPNEAIRRNNKRIIDTVLSGKVAEQGDLNALQESIKGELAPLGNHRFIKPSEINSVTWKKLLKDFEWEVEVDVTGEPTDLQATMTTLFNVLQTVAGNPTILQDPTMKSLFSKILELTGAMSPIEIPESKPPIQQPPSGGRSSAGQTINKPQVAQPQMAGMMQ